MNTYRIQHDIKLTAMVHDADMEIYYNDISHRYEICYPYNDGMLPTHKLPANCDVAPYYYEEMIIDD
jgi:hypothetical protein